MLDAPPLSPLATIIDANFVDYLIVALYFAFVLGIGLLARRQVSDSVDFFLSGRSMPAWVTGLAFVSANLGAVEIMGMSANGAEIGLSQTGLTTPEAAVASIRSQLETYARTANPL